jgi:EmrB/QacA subfamily drug resistance transporter
MSHLEKREIQYGGLKQVFAVSIGLFLVFLDSTVVNIALPNIIDDYNITLSKASWIINAFVLVLAVLLVTFGKIADMVGRVKVFIIGLIIFTVSSFLCGFAPNEEILILSRVFQGFGGAMVIPTSMMLVRTAVPPEKTGMAMGIWGAIGALAVAIGPSLGGIVTEYIHWRWIFYINVPIVLMFLPFIILAFKGHKDVKAPFRLDVWGILTLSVSLFFLTYAILQGEELGWTSTPIYIYFGISLFTASLFILIERKVKYPLVDFTIFENRYYLSGVLTNLVGGSLLMGTLILLPIYLTQVKGYDTLESSFLITPLSAVMLVVAPMIGKMIDKIGYLIPMTVGYLFTIVGYLLLLNIDKNTTISYLVIVMAILGTGLGILLVTSVTVCTASVSDKHVSLGSGIFATSRNIGGSVGVALFVSLTLSFLNSYSVDVIENGKSRFEKSNIPQQVKIEIISRLDSKEMNFFEGEKQLNAFKVSSAQKEQMIAQKKEEALKALPAGATLPKEAEKKIVDGVNLELASIEKEVTSLQSIVRNDLQTSLVDAMSKAFLAGLTLAVLFSGSLFMLRKQRIVHSISRAVPKRV